MTVLAAVLLGLASPTARAITVDPIDPPGLEDRVTHMTLLETSESDCFEISIPRAGDSAAVRAVVPERYLPGVFGVAPATFAGLRLWDYVCRDLAVDGQRYTPTTQISLGGVAITARDGQPTNAFYLLWIETDNAVLAARYGQVGLPATFTPAMRSSVSELTDVPFALSFEVPDPSAHTVTAEAPTPPVPQPVTGSQLTLYHQGPAGEVALRYDNHAIGATAARVVADYREHQGLVPLIRFERLLQIDGSVTFPNSMARGSWTAAVARTD